MPGQGRKHLQLAGIGFADAWLGLEASATCWNWICRCLAGVGIICNLLELDLQMPGRVRKHPQFAGIGFADAWPGLEASATCWNWICRCLSWGRKHLQLAGYEFADAYHQVDIKNPTTIAVGLFFMSKKEQNVLVDLRSILC